MLNLDYERTQIAIMYVRENLMWQQVYFKYKSL